MISPRAPTVLTLRRDQGEKTSGIIERPKSYSSNKNKWRIMKRAFKVHRRQRYAGWGSNYSTGDLLDGLGGGGGGLEEDFSGLTGSRKLGSRAGLVIWTCANQLILVRIPLMWSLVIHSVAFFTSCFFKSNSQALLKVHALDYTGWQTSHYLSSVPL